MCELLFTYAIIYDLTIYMHQLFPINQFVTDPQTDMNKQDSDNGIIISLKV